MNQLLVTNPSGQLPTVVVATQRLKAGVALAAVGIATVLMGLTVDAFLHANDPGLAAEEGVFTLANPGHGLLSLGLVLTSSGVGLAAFELLTLEGSGLRVGRRTMRWVLGCLVVGAIGVLWVTSTSDHGHSSNAPVTTTMSDGQVVSSASAAIVDRSRLPTAQAAALTALSWSRPGSIEGQGEGHVHSASVASAPVQRELDTEMFLAELGDARSKIGTLDTVFEAELAGYVQAGTSVAGVGAHYVNWSLVDQPFNPAKPAMLLFETIGSAKQPELVGYSYWVSSVGEPSGFSGTLDAWHQHYGMCFVNGWLRSENVTDRSECAGDWVNGSDLWMLHAWVVPSHPNVDGVFADVNRSICPSRMSVPDVMSCDVYDD